MATARHAGDVTRDRRKNAGEALARRATLDTRGRAPRRATGDEGHSVAVSGVRGRVSCVTRRVPPRLRARSNGVADDHVRVRTKKVEAVPRRRESRAARARRVRREVRSECAVCWPREIVKGECSLRKMKIRDGLFLVPRPDWMSAKNPTQLSWQLPGPSSPGLSSSQLCRGWVRTCRSGMIASLSHAPLHFPHNTVHIKMAAFAATTPSLKVRALNDTRERRRSDPPALSDRRSDR